MGRAGVFAIALMLTGGAAFAEASPPPPLIAEPREPPPAEPSPAERTAIERLTTMAKTTAPADVLAQLDGSLATLPPGSPVTAMLQCVRGNVLVALGERTRAARAIAVCDQRLPRLPLAQVQVGSYELAVGKTRSAAGRVAFALEAEPRLGGAIQHELIDTLLLNLSYLPDPPERLRLLAALRNTDYARAHPDTVQSALADAIAGEVAAGRVEAATGLLADLSSPDAALDLLVDRRFAAIWPAIEQWAGDLSGLRDRWVADARGAFAREPSLTRRRELASALDGSGQGEQAVALLRAAIDDRSTWDPEGYDIGLVASRLAHLLNRRGQGRAGIAVLDRVEAAWTGQPFARRINLLTKRALLKLFNGQPAAALTDLETTERQARAFQSPPPEAAALDWYAAQRACALFRLGRTGEAGAILTRLEPTRLSNRRAFDLAAVCLSDRERFKAGLLADLANPHLRAGVLRALQPVAPARLSPLDAATRAMLLELRADPQVVAAIEAAGRDLPPVYAPALKGWRL